MKEKITSQREENSNVCDQYTKLKKRESPVINLKQMKLGTKHTCMTNLATTRSWRHLDKCKNYSNNSKVT